MEKEIQLSLTEKQLEALSMALDNRLSFIQERLKERGGSADYYKYFEQEQQLVTEIFNKIEQLQN